MQSKQLEYAKMLTPQFEQATPNQYSEIDIEKLSSLIDKGEGLIKKDISHGIILMGLTGSGKSTLANGLFNKELKLRLIPPEDPQEIIIDVAEDQQVAKIGHSSVISETTVPEYIYDETNQKWYFDCPGFGDTKCSEQEIANAVFISQIFKNVQNVKIIIVAQQEELNNKAGRGQLIINFIEQLINVFQEIDKILDSICLVVTKCAPIQNKLTFQSIEPSQKMIIENLKKFKESHEKSNQSNYFKNPAFSKLFSIFLQEEKVQIFKQPIGADGAIVQFPEAISEMINLLPYAPSPKINSSISPKVKLKLINFYEKLYNDGQQQGKELRYCISKFIQHRNLDDILKIKIFINSLFKLQTNFEIYDLIAISDEIKTEYTSRKKELEEFISFKPQNKVNILKLINFISAVQLPEFQVSAFLYSEMENINNDLYKSINLQKNQLTEKFLELNDVIKILINEYSSKINDQNQLLTLQNNLQESLKDDNNYLDNFIIALQKINDSQINNYLIQLKQIYDNMQNAFQIFQESQDDLGSFPNDVIKSALIQSYSGIQLTLNDLKNKQMIEDVKIQFQSQMQQKEINFENWKKQEEQKANDLKKKRDIEIAEIKDDQKRKEVELQQQKEQYQIQQRIIEEQTKLQQQKTQENKEMMSIIEEQQKQQEETNRKLLELANRPPEKIIEYRDRGGGGGFCKIF